MLINVVLLVLLIGLAYLFLRQRLELVRLKKRNSALHKAAVTFGKLSTVNWYYDRLTVMDKRSGGTFMPLRELIGSSKSFGEQLANEWVALEAIVPDIKQWDDQ